MWKVVCLLLCSLVACSFGQAYTGQGGTAWFYNQGTINAWGTQYGPPAFPLVPGSGCGYLSFPPSGYEISYTTGTNILNIFNGEICGLCLNVTSVTVATNNPSPYPSVPFIVKVTNYGPAWYLYQLDVYNPNGPAAGGWNIQYNAIPCPVSGNPVQWQLASGTSAWYMQLLPVYQTITIAQMCVNVDGTWKPMTKMSNGPWSISGVQLPTSPQVKAIAVDGQVLVDTINVALSTQTSIGVNAVFGGLTPGNFGPARVPIVNPSYDCNAGATVTANVASPTGGSPPSLPASSTNSQSSATNTQTQSNGSGVTLSGGAIAGIVIGSTVGGVLLAVLFIAIIGVVVFVIIKKRRSPHNYSLMKDGSNNL